MVKTRKLNREQVILRLRQGHNVKSDELSSKRLKKELKQLKKDVKAGKYGPPITREEQELRHRPEVQVNSQVLLENPTRLGQAILDRFGEIEDTVSDIDALKYLTTVPDISGSQYKLSTTCLQRPGLAGAQDFIINLPALQKLAKESPMKALLFYYNGDLNDMDSKDLMEKIYKCENYDQIGRFLQAAPNVPEELAKINIVVRMPDSQEEIIMNLKQLQNELKQAIQQGEGAIEAIISAEHEQEEIEAKLFQAITQQELLSSSSSDKGIIRGNLNEAINEPIFKVIADLFFAEDFKRLSLEDMDAFIEQYTGGHKYLRIEVTDDHMNQDSVLAQVSKLRKEALSSMPVEMMGKFISHQVELLETELQGVEKELDYICSKDDALDLQDFIDISQKKIKQKIKMLKRNRQFMESVYRKNTDEFKKLQNLYQASMCLNKLGSLIMKRSDDLKPKQLHLKAEIRSIESDWSEALKSRLPHDSAKYFETKDLFTRIKDGDIDTGITKYQFYEYALREEPLNPSNNEEKPIVEALKKLDKKYSQARKSHPLIPSGTMEKFTWGEQVGARALAGLARVLKKGYILDIDPSAKRSWTDLGSVDVMLTAKVNGKKYRFPLEFKASQGGINANNKIHKNNNPVLIQGTLTEIEDKLMLEISKLLNKISNYSDDTGSEAFALETGIIPEQVYQKYIEIDRANPKAHALHSFYKKLYNISDE